MLLTYAVLTTEIKCETSTKTGNYCHKITEHSRAFVYQNKQFKRSPYELEIFQ